MYQQQFLGYFITQCISMLLKQFVCLFVSMAISGRFWQMIMKLTCIIQPWYGLYIHILLQGKSSIFFEFFLCRCLFHCILIHQYHDSIWKPFIDRSIQVQMGLQSIPKGEIDVIVSFISINWKSGQPFASRQVSIKKNAKVNFEKMMQVQHYQNILIHWRRSTRAF